MTYDTSKLSLILQTIERGPRRWVYFTADTIAAVLAAGYISDATKKGLQLGDLVEVFSGTLNTALTNVPSTAAEGSVSEFASQPSYELCQVSGITTGAASLQLISGDYSSLVANFRNLLDGGDFTTNPWQRGTSQAADITSTVTYMADRFFTVGGGSSAINWSKQADTGVAGFSQALRWQRKSANADTTKIFMGQVLETADSIRTQGQPITISFWVKCGANFLASSANFRVRVISGTGTDDSASNLKAGSWTGAVNVVDQNVAPTTADQQFIFTGTVPAAATQLGILIEYTPSGTAGANEWLQFKGFQLEIGGRATPFEHRDVQVELEICQRYFWQINEPASGVIVGMGHVSASNVELFYLASPVQMRIAPAVTVTVGTFKSRSATAGVVAATGLTGNATHTVNAIGLTSTGTGTAGQGATLEGGGGTGLIAISAEF